jgi:hypothetical protein
MMIKFLVAAEDEERAKKKRKKDRTEAHAQDAMVVDSKGE